MWQEKLPKSYLGEVFNVAKLIKALGIVNTHSGTCLGILLDRTDSDLLVKIKKAGELLKNISVYET